MGAKNKTKPTNNSQLLNVIGIIFLVITPVVYFLVPATLNGILCPPASCGYAGLGIAGYALYFSLIPFCLAITAFIASFIVRKKK